MHLLITSYLEICDTDGARDRYVTLLTIVHIVLHGSSMSGSIAVGSDPENPAPLYSLKHVCI